MVEEELFGLYKATKEKLAKLIEDFTFGSFYRALQSGNRTYALKNSQIEKVVDEDWVNAISECIPHIETIVNKPRSYMKREHEVVPIEKAKIINSESVKHLAAHTNLINSVENGMVRPNKILTQYNEESLELYENRFIMTLIIRVSQFIDRRYFLLGTGGNEFSSGVQITGSFEQEGEETTYSVNLDVHQGAEYLDSGISAKVYRDLYMARKYVNSFKYSKFMKDMSSYAMIKPPVLKTNLLTKDPDYRACMTLWEFISAYDKAGYKIDVTNSSPNVDRETIDSFDAITLMQYIVLKNKMASFDGRTRHMKKCAKKVIMPEIKELDEREDQVEYDSISTKKIQISLQHSDKKEVEAAVKEAVKRALKAYNVKREIMEAEQQKRYNEILGSLEGALEDDKQRRETEADDKVNAFMDTVKKALDAEKLKYNEQLQSERSKEKALKGAMQKALRYDQKDKLFDSRMSEQNQELYSAILSDYIALEENRRYEKQHPLFEFSKSALPVIIRESELPVPSEVYDHYDKMFAPDPYDVYRMEKKTIKPRKRFKDARVESAVKFALKLEENRRIKREESLKAEQERADEERRAALEAEEKLIIFEESEVTEGDGASGISNVEQDFALTEETGLSDQKSGTESEETDEQKRVDSSVLVSNGEKSVMPAEDIKQSFWRKLVNFLFGWMKRK